MIRLLANAGLTVLLAGLVAVATAAAIVPAVTGTRLVFITAPSMQAVLPQGSAAYIEPVDQPRVGDWITFTRNGNFVTHEVVEWAQNPANADRDGLWLQTKGTSNAEDDSYLVNRENVLGRVVYHLPWAGTALTVIGKPPVIAFLCLLALSLYLASNTQKENQWTSAKTPAS